MNFNTVIKRYETAMQELLSNTPRSFAPDLNQHLPTSGGIYRVFEVDGNRHETLYIGRTRNLQQRLYDDLYQEQATMTLRGILERNPEIQSVKTYLEEHCMVQVAVVPNLEDRTYLTHFCIAVLRPSLNQ